MHDGPAQLLANVMMRSDLIEKIYRERGIEEALEEIRGLKKTIREALYEVRHIIYDLRPMALDVPWVSAEFKKISPNGGRVQQTSKHFH